MAIKRFWAKVGKWRSNGDAATASTAVAPPENPAKPAEMVTIETVKPAKNDEQLATSLAFDLLVAQLEGINENLGKHADQQQQLLERMNQLPEVLASLPQTVESQKDLSEAICAELSRRELKEAQFLEAVESIPRQTDKQSNILEEMNSKLSSAVDANVQVGENFHRFNSTMGKLNKTSNAQTDSITQMNKTFEASDRYLKYIISRQNTRFMWMFITSIGICLTAIISLIVVLAIIWGK